MTLEASLLRAAIDAVDEAAAMLVEESRRPAGPRGAGSKVEIDVEIEHVLADRLTDILRARFFGEETPTRPDDGSAYCWLVDPHDGTWAWLQGHRGSAVSVALLREGVPVLGVVCAPMSLDRGRDLIAWAEGLPHLLRNGVEVSVDLAQAGLTEGAIVFLDHSRAKTPVASGTAVAPARFVSLPSIAYRLARVAAGDGVATLSLSAPGGLDYAAGHALLRCAGGVLLNEDGQEVTYSSDGASSVRHCFGGAPEAARELAARPWPPAPRDEPSRTMVRLSWPRTVEDHALDRAKGCLFGQLIGDNLGALVEFEGEDEIARRYPDGVRDLQEGGTWDILAGQATDDSELALALARTLIETKHYDREAVAGAYGDWYASGPFDCGYTIGQALSAAATASAGCKAEAASSQASAESQANGSLMRISPIGIWAREAEVADRVAREDSRLTHPNEVCVDACGAFAAAVAEGIRSGDRSAMLRAAQAHARTGAVKDDLGQAELGEFPEDYQTNMGWVRIALQNAFCHLRRDATVEEALVATVGKGGDTDTNAAIAGALLGAADGLGAIPPRWVLPVQACRPHADLGALNPRPMFFWPDDLAALAEALLAARSAPA